MNDILAAHFQTIRARIEGDVKPHSIIMVTSATADDGSRFTAFGLAECLAAVGRQTAFVDATTNPASAVNGRFQIARSCDFPIYSLPLTATASSRARDAIESFGRQTREAFDYTIVNAPPFGRQSVTVAVMNIVDAVLLSLLIGRQATKADDLLVRSLESAGTHILGVVGVEKASLAHFNDAGTADYVQDRHPPPASVPNVVPVIPQIRIHQER